MRTLNFSSLILLAMYIVTPHLARAADRLVFRIDPADKRVLQLVSIDSDPNIKEPVGIVQNDLTSDSFSLNDANLYIAQAKVRLAAGIPYRAVRLNRWDIGKCIRSRGDSIRYRARERHWSIFHTAYDESKGPGAILDLDGYHRIFGFEGCEVEYFDSSAAFLVVLNQTAYDVADFGNFMWGACMNELHFPRWVVKTGSEINAFLWSKEQNGWANSRWFWKNWEWTGDAAGDQRAIRNGYIYWSKRRSH